jgi:hypothetical protein
MEGDAARQARERKRALLRLAFGSVQIMGASAGLYLLLKTGASVATGLVVGITMVVTIVSRLLFASDKYGACKPAAERTKNT